jgi:hypothetical protein
LATCGWCLCVADLLWTAFDIDTPVRRLRSAVCAILIVVSVLTLQRELSKWRNAAQLRDRVLASGREAASDGHCETAPSRTFPTC